MKKAEPLPKEALRQPASHQDGGTALASPQGKQIAQLKAMFENSPQAEKLDRLATKVNDSPAMAAQRKLSRIIHSSPRQAAQRNLFEGIHNAPAQTAQRVEGEEPLQGKFTSDIPAQLNQQPIAKPNNTGLPDNLKSGIENLSGISMDNVKVHYNSSQPAQLNALAYAQGTDIHVAPGQEQHLPHEAWHVVQQSQGRVQPTMQMKEGVAVNDDKGLEHEADVMGKKAMSVRCDNAHPGSSHFGQAKQFSTNTIQRNLATIDDVNPNNLNAFKTAIDPDTNQTQGRGATTTANTMLRTNITWSNIHGSSYQGTGVDCHPIGPDHPLGSPTSSSSPTSRSVKAFNLAFIGEWKQGHLLNAKLGGPADKAENLVAISQSTNSQMEQLFENDLIRRINNNGEWMHFRVSVKYKQITDKNSKAAARKQGFREPYWAKSLDVSWGPVDSTGQKTGNEETAKITAPEPVARGESDKNPRSVSQSNLTPTPNNAPGVSTTIGRDDIVLNSADEIREQFDRKSRDRNERLEIEIEDELSEPLSPLRNDDLDVELRKTYPTHPSIREQQGGIVKRVSNYQKRIKNSTEPYPSYKQDFITAYKSKKSEEPHDYPNKIGELLMKNRSNPKLTDALDAAEPAYEALGTRIKQIKDYLSFLHEANDCMILIMNDDFYGKDPRSFEGYYLALKKSLTAV